MNTVLLRPLVIVVGIASIISMIWSQNQHQRWRDVAAHQRSAAASAIHQVAWSPQTAQDMRFSQDQLTDLLKNPLTNSDMIKADALVGSIKASEWLGPMAPIAISPFFGVTMLAGLAQFGEHWVPVNNFLSSNAALKNPAVFWVFLVLTIFTSVPRFTKVSKGAAQAIDQVEAYAGIITIITLRLMMMPESVEDPVVMQAGLFTLTADTLMCVAAVINIIVINTVKFFFEVSVWLIPFPFVDAMLEVGNKTVCVALMAVYAYSPLIATVLNLIIFGVSLVAFRWIYRRTVYLRTMLLEPVLALAWPGYGTPQKQQLTVFNTTSIGPFAAKSRLRLTREEQGWKLTERRVLLPGQSMLIDDKARLVIHKGVLGNHIELTDQNGDTQSQLVFSRRFSGNLEQLAELIGVKMKQDASGAGAATVDLHTI